VESQLRKAKAKLEKEFEIKVDMLAWPFGIYDGELVKKAIQAGYIAAFTMERREATPADNIMTLPRYLVVDPTGKNGKGGKNGQPGIFSHDQRQPLSAMEVFKE
jgi:hypothetical protein